MRCIGWWLEMIILALICSKPIYRMAPCVAPSKISGLRTYQHRKEGGPPNGQMAQTSHWCSCNQLSYPAQPCSLETKPFTARLFILPFFPSTTQRLDSITIESPTTFYTYTSTHRSICLLKSLSPFPPSR